MAKESVSKFKKIQAEVREFLEEKGIVRSDGVEPSKLHKFCHFWLLVAKSFSKNRCPVRASALAYATLLALIPMLAVALSVSTSILKKDGEERILGLVNQFIDSVVPPAPLTNSESTMIEGAASKGETAEQVGASPGITNSETGEILSSTNSVVIAPASANPNTIDARKQVAKQIHDFIQNTQSATLGITGTVLLLFVAISMLSRIESTFNDIWGVTHGRSWGARVVQYWAVITLGPILLAAALGLSNGPHFRATKELLDRMPFISNLLFQFLPVVVLCLAFALFYRLMPNTKVQWRAALVGGLVGGVLWHVNNLVSVLYVSRVVTNSKIYGSLAMVPVFMMGLYFSWLILLFGAQVAYAFQNRVAYLQEKMVETVSQRGREFIALRIMQCVGERFQLVKPAPTVPEMAAHLGVPTKLVQQLVQTLLSASLVVAVAGKELGYAPARPLETITCHDILLAMRTGQGQELATRDEPARTEVYGEFEKILEAERKVASEVTMLALVNRVEVLAAVSKPERKSVTD
ncbi:MAG: Ribonuclease [Pedosphaera sp.]|nr:Ribonuclease [Pedosphaera sp.]